MSSSDDEVLTEQSTKKSVKDQSSKKKRPAKKSESGSDSDDYISDDKANEEKSSGSKKAKIETVVSASGEELLPLGGKDRFVSVSRFKGRLLINIREYYQKEGKYMPGNKGISLSTEQFYALEKLVPELKKRINDV